MDGNFNDILDHVEKSSFFPYAGPQCNGGDTAQKKCILEGGDTTHYLLMGGTILGGDTTQH